MSWPTYSAAEARWVRSPGIMGVRKVGFNSHQPVAVPNEQLRGMAAILDFVRFLAQSGALDGPVDEFWKRDELDHSTRPNWLTTVPERVEGTRGIPST